MLKIENGRRHQKGFTLLEILIATAILGIMMVLLFGSISLGARVWDAGEKRAAKVDKILIIHNFIREHLSRARPVIDDFSEDQEEEGPVFAFSGTEETLRFVSILPTSAGRGGMYQFTLEAVEDEHGEGKVLMAQLRAFYPSLDDVELKIEDVRLLDEISGIELAYFGIDQEFGEDEEDREWLDEWEDKSIMPQLVKLIIHPLDGIRWPPLIVNPRIELLEQANR